jgi:hypothetical protein
MKDFKLNATWSLSDKNILPLSDELIAVIKEYSDKLKILDRGDMLDRSEFDIPEKCDLNKCKYLWCFTNLWLGDEDICFENQKK